MNIDNILRDALICNEIPSQNLVDKVKNHSKINGKPLSGCRRNPMRYIAILATTIIVLVIGGCAMAYYWGSFDRLSEIIGDEKASTLQPIEIYVGGDKNKSMVSMQTTGFEIELVAVGVHSNVVDLYITLEDLYSNRLDGEFSLIMSLDFSDDTPSLSSSQIFDIEIIDRAVGGIVTLYNRTVFDHSIAGRELVLHLHGIVFLETNDIIRLDSFACFEIEAPYEYMELVIENLDIQIDCCLEDRSFNITEVRITPYSAIFSGYFTLFEGAEGVSGLCVNLPIIINKMDGSFVDLNIGFSRADPKYFTSVRTIDDEYLDLDQIHSIELNKHVLLIDQTNIF